MKKETALARLHSVETHGAVGDKRQRVVTEAREEGKCTKKEQGGRVKRQSEKRRGHGLKRTRGVHCR